MIMSVATTTTFCKSEVVALGFNELHTMLKKETRVSAVSRVRVTRHLKIMIQAARASMGKSSCRGIKSFIGSREFSPLGLWPFDRENRS